MGEKEMVGEEGEGRGMGRERKWREDGGEGRKTEGRKEQ